MTSCGRSGRGSGPTWPSSSESGCACAGPTSASAPTASSRPARCWTPRRSIGYARRFTAYKRPELIFRDVERLTKILNAADRPVQLVFAGKAHPADEPAKHHLQHIFKHCIDPAYGGRIAFID